MGHFPTRNYLLGRLVPRDRAEPARSMHVDALLLQDEAGVVGRRVHAHVWLLLRHEAIVWADGCRFRLDRMGHLIPLYYLFLFFSENN